MAVTLFECLLKYNIKIREIGYIRNYKESPQS